MAEFSKLVITKSGQALLSEILAEGGKLEFSRVCISDVETPETELEALETLSQIRQESPVTDITKTSEQAVIVEAAFSNTDLTEGYFMRTLGLFAKHGEKNVLYAAAVETSGHCYMPPYNGVTVSGAIVQLVTAVGNSENVSLKVDSVNTKIDKDDVSNPNLLVNPDFRINQRGLTEYTNSSNAYTFAVDRWAFKKGGDASATITVADNGVTMSPSTAIVHFMDSELIDNITGKTLTLSVNINDVIISETFTWTDQTYFVIKETDSLRVAYSVTGKYIQIFNTSTTESKNVKWAKLEISSVATQFVAPDPLTEKVKCGIPDDTSTYGYRAIVNADSVSGITVSNDDTVGLRKIYAGTSDMTAGTSALESGAIYLVYE